VPPEIREKVESGNNYWTNKQYALCTTYQRKRTLSSKEDWDYKPIKIAYGKIHWKPCNKSEMH